MTQENVNWIMQEIDKGQANCPKICSFSIIGDNNVCVNSDITYTLDVTTPLNCITIWQPSTRYQIIASTNNSITIRLVSNGLAFIKAHIINPCGADVYLTKEIHLGPPYFGVTYKDGRVEGNPVAIFLPSQGNSNPFNNVCIGYNGIPNVYIDAQLFGTNNITWSVPNGYSSSDFSLYTGYGNRAYFGWNYGGVTPPGYIQASINNAFGSNSLMFAFKQVNCGTPGGNPCTGGKGILFYSFT